MAAFAGGAGPVWKRGRRGLGRASGSPARNTDRVFVVIPQSARTEPAADGNKCYNRLSGKVCTMEIPVYATGEVQMQVAHWLTVKQPEWVRFHARGDVAEVYVRIDNTVVQLGVIAQRLLDSYSTRTGETNESKSVRELCKFLNANAANVQYDFGSYRPNYIEVSFYI